MEANQNRNSNTKKPGTEDFHTDTYQSFTQLLRRSLLLSTGLKKDRIYFKRAADYPPTNGDRLFVICETRGDTQEVCGLYIEDLYESYMEGTALEEIIAMIQKELNKIRNSGIIKRASQLQNYEDARKDLFIRLLNADRHKNELKNAVYHLIGDIALVLYMYVGEIDQCTTSMKISRDTAEMWGLDPEDIFSDALNNTFHLSPPRIYCWEKMIFDKDYDGESFMSPQNTFQIKKDCTGNCLSTSRRTNGAVAIFLPGVARRLAELMGHSFYLAFTSIHEVMIHNSSQVEPEDLSKVLSETVRETTPDSDFLSLKIYYYDKNTGEFSFL